MSTQQFLTLLRATGSTLALTMTSIVIGVLLAFGLALMRMGKNKALKSFAWTYIWIFRGTPLLLQILTISYMIPLLYLNITGQRLVLPLFMAGVAGLALNTAAYCAEIIRAGIESIDSGQAEAARALGMNKRQTMIHIILPQTIKRLIPPFANEFTMILKDSSLVSAIGFVELYRRAKDFASTGHYGFLFAAGGIYLFLTTLSTFVFDRLERHYGRYL